MHIQTLLETIEKSPEFQDFKKKNKNAELTAGFMVLDLVKNTGDYSLDYLVGKQKIASFTLPAGKKEISLREDEILDKTKKLVPLNIKKVNTGIDKVQHIIQEEMKINSVDKKMEKMIAVLHEDSEGKTVWNLTCICQGLIIISALIDAEKGKLLKFDKKGLFDFVIPMKMQPGMQMPGMPMQGMAGMAEMMAPEEEPEEQEETGKKGKKGKKSKKQIQKPEKNVPEYIQ